MGGERAEAAADDLSYHIRPELAPPQTAVDGHHERDRRVEVRARDRPERQDQHHQDGSGRYRIAEERDRDVPARKLLGHDARADDRRNEETCAERFRRDAPGQGLWLHATETLRPCSSMTGSPSSFENGPCCGTGRISRTASEGRASFTPHGVTTIGRLMRIGCANMASRSWSSVRLGSERPNSA